MALTKRQLLEVLNDIRIYTFEVHLVTLPGDTKTTEVVPHAAMTMVKTMAENAIKGEMP